MSTTVDGKYHSICTSPRCYHSHISGAEAEQQLKTFGEHGCFLLRDSSEEAGTYTLSVL